MFLNAKVRCIRSPWGIHAATRMTVLSLMLCFALISSTLLVLPHPVSAAAHPLENSFVMGSTLSLNNGQVMEFAVVMLNTSGSSVKATVVNELPGGLDYQGGSASHGGVYDSDARTITWEDVTVPAQDGLDLSYEVTTHETSEKSVTNTAMITAGGETIERSLTIKLNEGITEIDPTRPKVEQFYIADKDVLTSRDVTLHIQASDDGAVEKMYIREWVIGADPIPHWAVVKSSGWVDYDTSLDWTFGSESGVHFLAAWVSDDDDKISLPNHDMFDYASLLRADTELKANQLLPYLVSFEAGEQVEVEVDPSSGNPDLFVWYPGSAQLPNKVGKEDGSATELVTFTAPRDGTYLFLVYAKTDTTFDVSITPAGGPIRLPTSDQPIEYDPSAPEAGFATEPLMSKIGADPLASGTTTVPQVTQTNLLFIPAVRH